LDSGAAQVAYYGGFGMPTVVLLGGNNHDVLFVTQNFTTGDTTTMRDLILNTFTAGTTELSMINSLEVFPNPSTDVIHLSFNVPSNTESFVELIDLDGKQVLVSEKTQLTEGLVQQELNVSGILSGSYLVRVHMNGTIATQNVNVAH
jgi:hypothetical protein